jgi:hypothetical protein
MGLSADLTWRLLALGARDTKTGWRSKTFTEYTIKGILRRKGSSFSFGGHGFYAKYDFTLWTKAFLRSDDEVIDADGKYYRVDTVEEERFLNRFEGYMCSLSKRDGAGDRAATSGTWHLDSDNLVTDVTYRNKYWLDYYIAAGNIKKDNGSTNADWGILSAYPDYSLMREFIDSGVDAIGYVEAVSCKAVAEYRHIPYYFDESVTIKLCAIDKPTVTAKNVLEQFYKEIQHVATDHPIGSIRSIDATAYKTEDLGGTTLWSTTVTLRYMRRNPEYTNSGVTVTFGLGLTFSTATSTTVGGSTTNIEVSSSHIGDSTDQWNGYVLKFTTGVNTGVSRTITDFYVSGGPAVAHFICDAFPYSYTAGDLFVLSNIPLASVTTETFALPNVTYFDFSPDIYNIRLPIPGRMGNILQKLGAPDYQITLKCNLDMEPWSGDVSDTKLSWKRPQTNGTKTDILPEQVFLDIYFNGITESSQTLNLGWGGSIPVTLEKPTVIKTNDSYELTLVFKVVSAVGASAYKTWFGINP